jgi:hypothetical protein
LIESAQRVKSYHEKYLEIEKDSCKMKRLLLRSLMWSFLQGDRRMKRMTCFGLAVFLALVMNVNYYFP